MLSIAIARIIGFHRNICYKCFRTKHLHLLALVIFTLAAYLLIEDGRAAFRSYITSSDIAGEHS